MNIIDSYIYRQKVPMFENLCLYEFAALYQPAYRQEYEDSDIKEGFPNELQGQKKFKLLNNSGFVTTRVASAVVTLISNQLRTLKIIIMLYFFCTFHSERRIV